MTSTTTVDCSGKNTSANNGTYPTRKAQENADKITTKHNEPQHPYFEEVLPLLGSQNVVGETLPHREKHSSVKDDIVKRRRDNDNLSGQTRASI